MVFGHPQVLSKSSGAVISSQPTKNCVKCISDVAIVVAIIVETSIYGMQMCNM